MHPDDGIAIFREIAAQHEGDGADWRLILEGLDHSEKATVSARDLEWTLRRLESAGFIECRAGRWFVTPALATELPRTRGGRISTGSEAWRRFAERRIKPVLIA